MVVCYLRENTKGKCLLYVMGAMGATAGESAFATDDVIGAEFGCVASALCGLTSAGAIDPDSCTM